MSTQDGVLVMSLHKFLLLCITWRSRLGGVAALGRLLLVAVEDECEGFQRFTKRHVPFKRTHHSFNQAVLIASIPKMQDFGQSPAVCGLRPT